MKDNPKEPCQNSSGTQFLEEKNRYLRETVTALRNSLELLKSEHEEKIQSTIQRIDEENRELKGTISALRDQLEETSRDAGNNLQRDLANFQSNLKELQDTISALRKNIEENRVKSQDRENKLKLQHSHQIAYLEKIAGTLREKLEAVNGSD